MVRIVIEAKTTILIADDERASRDVLSKALSAPGRRIEVVRNGYEAVSFLENEQCDVLVTDLNMPGMGGLDVFGSAKRLNPSPQVIFITGYGSLETVMGAIQDGAFDFVAKPFKLAEIQLVVRNACDKVRLLGELNELRQQLAEINSRRQGLPSVEGSAMFESVGRQNVSAKPALFGAYRRAAEGEWVQADTRLALERLRACGDISDEEYEKLAERLQQGRSGH